jgi:hypothetical protein
LRILSRAGCESAPRSMLGGNGWGPGTAQNLHLVDTKRAADVVAPIELMLVSGIACTFHSTPRRCDWGWQREDRLDPSADERLRVLVWTLPCDMRQSFGSARVGHGTR